jgi:hypothetical protein
MNDLHEVVAASLTDRYSSLAGRVRELAAPLNDDQFWSRPFGFGNSFGHLVLHLTGNLNYYLGAQIGETGYVRDRDREFADADRCPKKDVMARFDEAVATVLKTIQSQRPEDWTKAYTAQREDGAGNRFNIFLRCATHMHLHVGQMIYLTYQMQKEKAA